MSNDTLTTNIINLTTNITNTLNRAPVHDNICFFNAGREVLRISEKGVTANPDVPVDEAAAAVITALNTMLPIKRPWVGLTDAEIKEIIGGWGDTPIKGYTRKFIDQLEAKLKEKNT
jgi:hypothetical protein